MSTVVKNKVAGTPNSNIEVLFSSNTAFSTQSTTNNNVLKTWTLPGGTLGANDALEIHSFWSKTGTAGTFNAKIAFSNGSFVSKKAGAAGANISHNTKTIIRNNNSVSAQKFMDDDAVTTYVTSSVANGSSAIDTSADVDIEFVAYCGNAADTMVLEGVTISIVRAVGAWTS